MDGLNIVDPDRVHAVVVGLERYPRQPDWDLPGAAHDALRFARWLRKGGVPGANIRLLVAPGEESRRMLEAQAHAAELTWCPTWSRDELMDAFTSGLDGCAGDVLYVYWGSHGVLDHDDRRLLLCPDASLSDKRCIGITNLREHLARADLPGLGQQVLLFDTCATFLEHHHQQAGPAVAAFPPAPRRRVEQFLLYSAGAGQVAENDAAQRGGVFSRTALDWLEAHAVDLRPDLGLLAEHVDERFQELHATGAPLQTPVSLQIRSLDGSERRTVLPVRRPLPPSPERDHVTLVLRHVLSEADLRARCLDHLASACPEARLEPGSTDGHLAHALLTVRRAMAALVEVVHPRDREAADQLLSLARSLGMPGLLSPLEFSTLHEVLSQTSRRPTVAHMIAAVRAALPLERTWLPPLAGTPHGASAVDQLMACVEHFEEHAGGMSLVDRGLPLVPVVVRFTELLAAATPAPEDRARLHDWGDRVARRLGVHAGGLAERRADAANWAGGLGRPGKPPRVVAQLEAETPVGSDEGQCFSCVMWTDTGTGELVQAAEQCREPLSPQQVVRRIERTLARLRAMTHETPVVEILLRADSLHLPVDSWDGADDEDPLPTLLGVERAAVLRCAPLASAEREEQRRAELERRWAGRHNTSVVYLDDSHCEGHAAYGALKQDTGAARAVVRAGPSGRNRLVQAALLLGYPVILWDRQATGPVPDGHFAPVQPDADVDGLPWRVRDHRARVCGAPLAHTLRPAVLLEDADRPLPPVLSLTEPSGSRGESS
ncbi:hypothetical protein [Streptomyces sp. NPDC059828]|uniref:VMAP-C domain-containing protein n=1 Tax=Streptomyces sp. NPDC059828 TaxID=3346965 RepID=UPI00364C5907